MVLVETVSFSQILSTLINTLSFAQDAKDIPDLLAKIADYKPNDIFIKSLDNVLKEQQEILTTKEIHFSYDLDAVSKLLIQHSIDLGNFTITPSLLYDEIGSELISILLNNDIFCGVDIEVELTTGWIGQIVNASIEKYSKFINKLLFNDSTRQQLEYISKKVNNNFEIQSDIKQLLTLINDMAVQINLDYKTLTPKLVQELFGFSASLIDYNNIKPADEERLSAFYQGAPIWWDIILANGDVERDIQTKIIESYSHYPEKLTFFCLSGDPGEGKSTLAWRIAYEISKNQNLPLIQLKDYENKDFWYSLEVGIIQYGRPILILVDDVFRDFSSCRAIASINPGIPVLIISTSCTNEIPEDLITPFFVDYEFLTSPSEEETKKAVLKIKKSKPFSSLKEKNTSRLSSWLAIIYELTTGKELVKYVRESVKRLNKIDPVVYKAFEYLCFTSQFDIAMPVRLFDRLDDHGIFFNLITRQAAKGIFFYATNSTDYLRTKHSLFAKIGFEVYQRNPQNILLELFNAVDYSDQIQDRFINKLIIQLLKNNYVQLVKDTLNFPNNFSSFYKVLSLTSISQKIKIYQLLGDDKKVSYLTSLMINFALSGSYSKNGWIYAAKFIEDEKLHKTEFIDTTFNRLIRNPEDTFLRTVFLKFVENNGNPDQIQAIIFSTFQWLSINSSNQPVLSAFLGYVERNGNIEQIQELIRFTIQWLTTNQTDQIVRSTFLGFITRKGNLEQIQEISESYFQWLFINQTDQIVRTTFLRFIERKGTPHQIQDTINLTIQWLLDNQTDQIVRSAFLGFLERNGNYDQIHIFIDNTLTWLTENIENKSVRTVFFGLVDKYGTSDQILTVIDSTINWISENLSDQIVLPSFLRFLERNGNANQFQDVTDLILKTISFYPLDRDLCKTILLLSERNLTIEQIQTIISLITQLFSNNQSYREARSAFLKFVEKKGSYIQIQDLIFSTLEWLTKNPVDQNLRYDFLEFIWRNGSEFQIQNVIDSISKWLLEYDFEPRILETYLVLVEEKGNFQQIQTAIQLTSGYLKTPDYNTKIGFNYLQLLINFGNLDQIKLEKNKLKTFLQSERFTELHNFNKSLLLANYGSILLILEEYSEVERVSIQSLLEIKGMVKSRFNLAWSYYFQGKKDDSLNELKHSKWWAVKARKYNPEIVFFQLGLYWFLENNTILAKIYFSDSLNIISRNKNPNKFFRELGRTLLSLNDKVAVDKIIMTSTKSVRSFEEIELYKFIEQNELWTLP